VTHALIKAILFIVLLLLRLIVVLWGVLRYIKNQLQKTDNGTFFPPLLFLIYDSMSSLAGNSTHRTSSSIFFSTVFFDSDFDFSSVSPSLGYSKVFYATHFCLQKLQSYSFTHPTQSVLIKLFYCGLDDDWGPSQEEAMGENFV